MDTLDKAPDVRVRALTSRVLWLGAVILTMLATVLIIIGLTYSKNIAAPIAIGFGINLFTGAVGAALFEILIRRPQGEQPDEVTRSDITAVLEAVQEAGHDLSSLGQHLADVTTFVRRQAKAAPLEESQVAQVFTSRALASTAMHDAACKPELSEVRILGVTLGDFLNGSFGSAWWELRRYLNGETPLPPGSGSLSVKVLACDPKSLAAQLINIAGSDNSTSSALQHDEEDQSALEADFNHIFARLRPLLGQVNPQREMTLEYRICREFPTSFMFAADRTIFVQPHLLQHHQAAQRLRMPVLKYESTAPISAALIHQFDVLWKYASAAPDRLIEGKPVRISGGAARTGIVELYTSVNSVRGQLERLLLSAKERVMIQGISNIPIIRAELNEAFIEAVNRPDVNVRVLILDPRSQAAKQKTFARYQSMGDPRADVGWSAYSREPPGRDAAHQSSDIYNNIRISLDWFIRVARDANRRQPGKVTIKLCSSVEAFILVVDNYVLFEPYHFGDEFNLTFPAQTSLQLAGNMPTLEFHAPSPAPFPPRHGANINSPLEVCVSHFNRVFENFSVDAPNDVSDLES